MKMFLLAVLFSVAVLRAQRQLHEVKESEDAEEARLAVKERRKAAFKGS